MDLRLRFDEGGTNLGLLAGEQDFRICEVKVEERQRDLGFDR